MSELTFEIEENGQRVTGYGMDGRRDWSFGLDEIAECPYKTLVEYVAFLTGLGYKRRDSIAPTSAERIDYYFERPTDLTFPSGATLTTSGDKIVGRTEPDYAAIEREHFGDADKATGIYAPQPEPIREPLPHFQQQTAHDPFGDGFIVTKGAVEVIHAPSPTTQGAYPAIAGLLRVRG